MANPELTAHLEGLLRYTPSFLPRDDKTLRALVERSRKPLTSMQLFELPRLMGALANQGYDPVPETKLPEDHRVHHTPYEQWIFMVSLSSGTQSFTDCVTVRKRFAYPNGPCVLQWCQATDAGDGNLYAHEDRVETFARDHPMELSVDTTRRLMSRYPGVVFPMNVGTPAWRVRASAVKDAVPFSNTRFGLGTSGYVFPRLTLEGDANGTPVAGIGVFVHTWSYGVQEPTFPRAFLQRAMGAAFVGLQKYKPAAMSVARFGQTDIVGRFPTIPEDGGTRTVEAIVSHADGKWDVYDTTWTRKGDVYTLEYEPLGVRVSWASETNLACGASHRFASGHLYGTHDGHGHLLMEMQPKESEGQRTESTANALGVAEARIVGPSNTQGAAAVAFWMIPILLFMGIVAFVVFLVIRTGVWG